MALLSVDIGTTSTKAVLFTKTGEIIASSFQEYPLVYPKPGWAELNAEIIWGAFRKTVREVAKQHQKKIKALCLSCMANNIVPFAGMVQLSVMASWLSIPGQLKK